jgi:hypothetical protein
VRTARSHPSGFPPPSCSHRLDAGKRFFDELDADKDGRIDVTDLKRAMKARNLPEDYAYSFMDRAKRNPFARSIGYADWAARIALSTRCGWLWSHVTHLSAVQPLAHSPASQVTPLLQLLCGRCDAIAMGR